MCQTLCVLKFWNNLLRLFLLFVSPCLYGLVDVSHGCYLCICRFGTMVACFRYASIDVHSVYLPPSKLDFNYENQEWIQRELDEVELSHFWFLNVSVLISLRLCNFSIYFKQVVDRAELLFSEVLNALRQFVEKRSGTGSLNGSLSRRQLVDLEGMLHKEKSEFKVRLLDVHILFSWSGLLTHVAFCMLYIIQH